MGTIIHDAIVVTGTSGRGLMLIEAARWKAEQLGLACSTLVTSPIGGYVTFLIAPDGSKEGWADSDAGDKARQAWIAWADAPQRSLGLSWAHVRYGEVDGVPYVPSRGEGES